MAAPDDVDYWPLRFPPRAGFRRRSGRSPRRSRRRSGNTPPAAAAPAAGGGQASGGGDKWGHTGLPPDERGGNGRGGRGGGGFRNYGAPVSNRADPRLPALQQIENKFVAIDKSKMDEEERKQRAFKSILNKLTPQNFEKLLEKVLEEGIGEAQTLIGLIAQLFDKALTEPTFAELYAMMCQQLSDRFLAEGVEFKDPASEDPENPKVITFKRVLLMRCQEEFEKGDGAIKDAEKAIKDAAELKARVAAGEEAPKEAAEDKEKPLEEGEVPPKPKTKEELELDERRKDQQRADAMLVARRRMLGNIRFIGELFKKQMLTERIMHTCVVKLLPLENPDEEDVEALCKLLSTIGSQLDHARAKEHMDAYFRRIEGLSRSKEISSRHRFMCQDVIEMRGKGWRERRKQEGPKKIEDVHRDAAREAMNQARGGGPGRRVPAAATAGGGARRRPRRGRDRDFPDRSSRGDRGGGGGGGGDPSRRGPPDGGRRGDGGGDRGGGRRTRPRTAMRGGSGHAGRAAGAEERPRARREPRGGRSRRRRRARRRARAGRRRRGLRFRSPGAGARAALRLGGGVGRSGFAGFAGFEGGGRRVEGVGRRFEGFGVVVARVVRRGVRGGAQAPGGLLLRR